MLKLKICCLIFTALIGNLNSTEIPKTSSRILGGVAVPIDAYPYIVSIQLNGLTHYCCGIIIDEYQILTTASCVTSPHLMSIVSIVAGSQEISCADCGNRYQVLSRIAHQDYNPITLANNIGILKLDKPIIYGIKVQPAVISAGDTKTGQTVFAVGWGWNHEGKYVLVRLPTTILNSLACTNKYTLRHVVTRNNICTLTFPGEGTCAGDFGSPLVNRKNELVAISSHSEIPCPQSSLPNLYTRLDVYKEWIAEHTEEI